MDREFVEAMIHRLGEHVPHRRRQGGRPKAKVAAARKLLTNCYVMLRDGISYSEFCRRGEIGMCVGSGEVKSVGTLQSLKA